jgi:hypothetical protein
MYAVIVFGFAADTIATATGARLPQRGLLFAGIGLAGTGFIAAAVQNPAVIRNGLFDAGAGIIVGDVLRWGLLNGLPLLGGLIVFLVLLLALKGAKPRAQAPFIFGFLAAGMVFVGAAVNAAAHIEPLQLIGTSALESAWLYVVYGGVLGGLGALVYWGPKWNGRFVGVKALPLALLGVLATVLASLSLLLAAIFDDESFVEIMWWVSAAGHALMALTVLATIGLVLRGGDRNPGDDPWDGQTLEWATSSPAPYDNFSSVFSVTSPEPLLDMKPAEPRSDA